MLLMLKVATLTKSLYPHAFWVSPKKINESLFGLALLYRWKEMKNNEQNANLIELEGLRDAERFYGTASGGCGRSMGGFAFFLSESKPRKWWTRKLRERGKRPREHFSARQCAMPTPREWSEW